MPETPRPWHVYLLRCSDGSLYCGVTTDLARRVREHNAGTGAKYTRPRRPVALEASAAFPGRAAALRAEYAVKRQPASNKIAFLAALPGQCPSSGEVTDQSEEPGT